jgi:hypothetical protein
LHTALTYKLLCQKLAKLHLADMLAGWTAQVSK